MPRYRVHMEQTVAYSIEVEADDEDAARDKAEMQGLPGLMFLDHRYPDEGEWEAVEVSPIA